MILPRALRRSLSATAELSGFWHAERLPLAAEPQPRRPASLSSFHSLLKLDMTSLSVDAIMETVGLASPSTRDAATTTTTTGGNEPASPSGPATSSTSTPVDLGMIHPFFNLPLTTGSYHPSVHRSCLDDYPVCHPVDTAKPKTPELEDLATATSSPVSTPVNTPLSTPSSTFRESDPETEVDTDTDTNATTAPTTAAAAIADEDAGTQSKALVTVPRRTYAKSEWIHTYKSIHHAPLVVQLSIVYQRPPANNYSFHSFSDLAVAEGLIPNTRMSLKPVKQSKSSKSTKKHSHSSSRTSESRHTRKPRAISNPSSTATPSNTPKSQTQRTSRLYRRPTPHHWMSLAPVADMDTEDLVITRTTRSKPSKRSSVNAVVRLSSATCSIAKDTPRITLLQDEDDVQAPPPPPTPMTIPSICVTPAPPPTPVIEAATAMPATATATVLSLTEANARLTGTVTPTIRSTFKLLPPLELAEAKAPAKKTTVATPAPVEIPDITLTPVAKDIEHLSSTLINPLEDGAYQSYPPSPSIYMVWEPAPPPRFSEKVKAALKPRGQTKEKAKRVWNAMLGRNSNSA